MGNVDTKSDWKQKTKNKYDQNLEKIRMYGTQKNNGFNFRFISFFFLQFKVVFGIETSSRSISMTKQKWKKPFLFRVRFHFVYNSI